MVCETCYSKIISGSNQHKWRAVCIERCTYGSRASTQKPALGVKAYVLAVFNLCIDRYNGDARFLTIIYTFRNFFCIDRILHNFFMCFFDYCTYYGYTVLFCYNVKCKKDKKNF